MLSGGECVRDHYELFNTFCVVLWVLPGFLPVCTGRLLKTTVTLGPGGGTALQLIRLPERCSTPLYSIL